MDAQLSKLFKFPIIMIDGDNEDKKIKEQEKNEFLLSNGKEEIETEVDIIIGEAECPYYDFVSITDRWLPTPESLQLAIKGKFEACNVIFSGSGSYMVPWTKRRFKKELGAFIETQPKTDMSVSILTNTQVEKILDSDK